MIDNLSTWANTPKTGDLSMSIRVRLSYRGYQNELLWLAGMLSREPTEPAASQAPPQTYGIKNSCSNEDSKHIEQSP